MNNADRVVQVLTEAQVRRRPRPLAHTGPTSHLPAPTYGHEHHPRSKPLGHLTRGLAWCGVSDIREHYPIWPWFHERPQLRST